MYTDDHAPLGEVAFRCEAWNLYNSASDIWALTTAVDRDLAERLTETAQWYEDMARTLDEIKMLPTPKPNEELVKRVQKYTS